MSKKTVWKYTVPIADEPMSHAMPRGAKIIEVAMQGDTLCFWAICYPREISERRTFVVRGTGQAISDCEAYAGTAHAPPFVWHLFEMI